MPDHRKYRGLCSMCGKAATCTFPRDPERPVMECDEFDGTEKLEMLIASQRSLAASIPSAAVFTEERNPGTPRGLCRNCKNLSKCTYPKPEGGVWHCDEYE
jgi:hypothetical protein